MSMVGQVGRAVMEGALGDRRGYRQTWDVVDDAVRAEIIEAVGRAAIEAMREPSKAMVDAGVAFALHVTISAEALSLLTQAAQDALDDWPEPAQTKLAEAIGEALRVLQDAGVDVGL